MDSRVLATIINMTTVPIIAIVVVIVLSSGSQLAIVIGGRGGWVAGWLGGWVGIVSSCFRGGGG